VREAIEHHRMETLVQNDDLDPRTRGRVAFQKGIQIGL
jgi:hypothetical protein